MNRDSNAYTFLFATLMVLVVASALAFTASSLKDLQASNVRKEKMQNILATIGIETDREQAEKLYNEYIISELSLTSSGDVDQEVQAFEIKLNNELKKPVDEQRFPLYEASVQGTKYYIVPLRGAGLWNAIWGYIALKEDKNTIQGLFLITLERLQVWVLRLLNSGFKTVLLARKFSIKKVNWLELMFRKPIMTLRIQIKTITRLMPFQGQQ